MRITQSFCQYWIRTNQRPSERNSKSRKKKERFKVTRSWQVSLWNQIILGCHSSRVSNKERHQILEHHKTQYRCQPLDKTRAIRLLSERETLKLLTTIKSWAKRYLFQIASSLLVASLHQIVVGWEMDLFRMHHYSLRLSHQIGV